MIIGDLIGAMIYMATSVYVGCILALGVLVQEAKRRRRFSVHGVVGASIVLGLHLVLGIGVWQVLFLLASGFLTGLMLYYMHFDRS